jgi:hypothetical protein
LAGEFECGLDRGFAVGVGAQRGGGGDDFDPPVAREQVARGRGVAVDERGLVVADDVDCVVLG